MRANVGVPEAAAFVSDVIAEAVQSPPEAAAATGFDIGHFASSVPPGAVAGVAGMVPFQNWRCAVAPASVVTRSMRALRVAVAYWTVTAAP
jgi:hypothetical protein